MHRESKTLPKEVRDDRKLTRPTSDVFNQRGFGRAARYLSFQETKTAALVASKLKEFGYEILEGIGRTGVVGSLWNGEGQTVLARADMDALPVRENTGLPYASTRTAVDDATADQEDRSSTSSKEN